MPTKLKDTQDIFRPTVSNVIESQDKRIVAVSASIIAGNSDIKYFIYRPSPRNDEPFLKGEDYPALVKAWDNEDDKIFDTL